MYTYMYVAIFIFFVFIILFSTVRIFKEYERGVLFRLGRLKKTKGPGLVFIIPLVDKIVRVDLRLVSIDVARQEIMTLDNVPATIDAIVYFKIINPANAITVIHNFYQSTFLIAQTSLRSVIGQVDLDTLLSKREVVNEALQEVIAKQTIPWGIEVPMVEIREVSLPEEMKRAMARQAEAERERRAMLIDAEGEFQAATRLVDAANIMQQNPITIQLKYLQTLTKISSEGKTIVFPFPMEFVKDFISKLSKQNEKK